MKKLKKIKKSEEFTKPRTVIKKTISKKETWFDSLDILKKRKIQIDVDVKQSEELQSLGCPKIVNRVFHMQKVSNQRRVGMQDSVWKCICNKDEYFNSVDEEQHQIQNILASKENNVAKCERLKRLEFE